MTKYAAPSPLNLFRTQSKGSTPYGLTTKKDVMTLSHRDIFFYFMDLNIS